MEIPTKLEPEVIVTVGVHPTWWTNNKCRIMNMKILRERKLEQIGIFLRAKEGSWEY